MPESRIVELNLADIARADECARRRCRMELRPGGDDDYDLNRSYDLRDENAALFYNVIGARGEIAFAKLVGVKAPLSVNTFRSQPDVPPNWDVKTQLSFSKDTLRGEMRLRPRDWHSGRRYVFIELAPALHNRCLLEVHGWIDEKKAREVARGRYSNSPNLFIHLRHLQPVEPLCELDLSRWTASDP